VTEADQERRPAARDQWASWFAEGRHGGDPEQLRQTLERLAPVRDRVMANAKIGPGSRVLDVGCGDVPTVCRGGQLVAAAEPEHVDRGACPRHGERRGADAADDSPVPPAVKGRLHNPGAIDAEQEHAVGEVTSATG